MSNLPYKRSIILGGFVFLALILIVLAVFTIGSQHKVFDRTLRIRIDFDDIEGLQAGNNVWLSGLKIGTVKKLEFVSGNRVEAFLDIDRKVKDHIWKNAKAKISSDGLIGNRIVVIYGGTPDAGSVAEDDQLRSEKSISTEDLLATLQQNNKNLLEITNHFKDISKKINEGKGTIGLLLNDEALAFNVSQTGNHLRAASKNSERLTWNIRAFSAGLDKPGGLANELLNDTSVFRKIQETLTELNEASRKASEFAGSMEKAGDRLNQGNNPAGMLLQDQAVASDLKEAISHLRTSSEKLDQDLEALQHNFLFRGYFRKKAKEAAKKAALAPANQAQ